MDAALKYRLDVTIALPFSVVLIGSYRAAGYFDTTFVVVVTIILVAFAPK